MENGGLMCGGYFTSSSCLQWSSVNGTWEEYLTLDVGRSGHVSWSPDSDIGTYLMGGDDSEAKKTTTLIKSDGSQAAGFILKYDTEYEEGIEALECRYHEQFFKFFYDY